MRSHNRQLNNYTHAQQRIKAVSQSVSQDSNASNLCEHMPAHTSSTNVNAYNTTAKAERKKSKCKYKQKNKEGIHIIYVCTRMYIALYVL